MEILELLSNELEQNKKLKTLNKYVHKQGFEFIFFVEDQSKLRKRYTVKAQSIFNVNNGNIDQNKLKLCKEKVQIIREFNHKNVVDIHSDFEIGFYHFIQFNDCINTLDNLINSDEIQINDDLFQHYASQIIDGIEFLHKKGYILGNYQAKNILVTIHGEIKICDFDFSKRRDNFFKNSDSSSKNENCSFSYLPLELFKDIDKNKEQVNQSQEGDIWALGFCLSQLGGLKKTDFSDIQNLQSQIPDLKSLSTKTYKIVKYILEIDILQRPTIQQIRKKINQLFFRNKGGEFILEDQQINNIGQHLNQINIERLIDFDFNQIDNLYEKYKQYEELHPKNIDTLITIGFIELRYHSNFSDAKKYFDKCLELNSNEIDAYLGLCMIILQLREYKYFNLANDYLEFCMRIRKDYWRVYYIKSRLLYLSDREKEGLVYLERALDLNKESIQLLSIKILFTIYYLRDIQKAQQLTKRAIILNIYNDPLILFRIGVYFYCQGSQNDRKQAIYYYQQALKYNPKDLDILLNLYLIYKENNEINEQSKEYLEKLKQLYPQNSYILSRLSDLEEDKNKKLKLYQDSIQIDEQNRYSYYGIAKLYKQQGNFDEMLKQYQKVFKFLPNDFLSNSYIAHHLAFKKNQFQKSLQYYKLVIKQNPYNTENINGIAKLYYYLQDYRQSLFYFKLCLQIDPQDTYANKYLIIIKKSI